MPNKKITIWTVVILALVAVFLGIYFFWKSDSRQSNGLSFGGEAHILYQKGRHKISSSPRPGGSDCYSLNLAAYLDAGVVDADGSDNKFLDLKDYPMSLVTSQKNKDYYYSSAATNPVRDSYGYSFIDWDLKDQILYSAGFKNDQVSEVKKTENGKFPGGEIASPDNQYLVYLMTTASEANMAAPTVGFISSKLDAYASDTDLIVKNISSGKEQVVLSGNYNRQLFASLADFSADGKYFYTIARSGDSFQFIRITLASGEVTDFSVALPGFDWKKINWEDFFKKSGDLAHASFHISPNAERMIVYKNIAAALTDVNACFTTATHKFWFFNIPQGTVTEKDGKDYAIHASWQNDSSQFAMAIVTAAGCYPGYMDARIEKGDKDDSVRDVLVTEPKSKITRIGWSPKGDEIAYDVYGTDLVGRIKTVNSRDKSTKEIVNTLTTEGSTDLENPVLLHFANWVME